MLPRLGPLDLAVLVTGGAVGTALRDALETAFGAAPGAIPVVTFAINVAGSFLLGALLEALIALGPEGGRRRTIRLALGTGLLGGFTTYSTFVVETVLLAEAGHLVVAVGYAVASLLAGFLAAYVGVLLARAWLRHRLPASAGTIP